MNDIKTLLIDALKILGCDSSRFNFDAHSTIVMSFDDVGDILLDQADDQLWIWGALPDVMVDVLGGRAHDLLRELTVPVEYLAAGAITLCAEEQGLRLGGMLQREYLEEPKHFAAAIEGFYLRLIQIKECIK